MLEFGSVVEDGGNCLQSLALIWVWVRKASSIEQCFHNTKSLQDPLTMPISSARTPPWMSVMTSWCLIQLNFMTRV